MKKDLDTDRWNRGVANPKKGTGGYSNDPGKDFTSDKVGGKVDKGSTPKSPYGSGHYPATDEG